MRGPSGVEGVMLQLNRSAVFLCLDFASVHLGGFALKAIQMSLCGTRHPSIYQLTSNDHESMNESSTW